MSRVSSPIPAAFGAPIGCGLARVCLASSLGPGLSARAGVGDFAKVGRTLLWGLWPSVGVAALARVEPNAKELQHLARLAATDRPPDSL